MVLLENNKQWPVNSGDFISSIKFQQLKIHVMKKTGIYFLFLMLAAVSLTSGQSYAQLQIPAASPAAHVSQVVGFTKISIDYSSPAVKGRTVFGELEKFGVPWRAGANSPTTIEFSTAVNIEGTNIGPGKYTLFITPQASGDWIIHLNSKNNAIYAYMVDGKINVDALKKDDAVSIKARPTNVTDSQERLSYTISAEDNKVAKVSMNWDKVKLSFTIDTQVDQKMEGFKTAF